MLLKRVNKSVKRKVRKVEVKSSFFVKFKLSPSLFFLLIFAINLSFLHTRCENNVGCKEQLNMLYMSVIQCFERNIVYIS